ncbi:MAG: hypothetical protein OXH75_07735 [Acidobacteria bacterium]|nr:hypothetical protein [Acidobacteriota bacterium]
MAEPCDLCPRCGSGHWEPLQFPTADGRTHKCAGCWLLAPGWCDQCLDTARRGWISIWTWDTPAPSAFEGLAPNSARWCPGQCYRQRTAFRAGKKDPDEDPGPEAEAAKAAATSYREQRGRDTRKDMDRLADGSWPAKWRQLKKRDGEWGAMVLSRKVRTGDDVTIERAGEGTTEIRTVDEVIWRGDGIALCGLEPKADDDDVPF